MNHLRLGSLDFKLQNNYSDYDQIKIQNSSFKIQKIFLILFSKRTSLRKANLARF